VTNKRVKYSDHAQDRMKSRQIAKNQVERTIERPDNLVLQPRNRFKATRKTSAGNTIAVYYIERTDSEGDYVFVITVFRC
jgi:hypothetical protein